MNLRLACRPRRTLLATLALTGALALAPACGKSETPPPEEAASAAPGAPSGDEGAATSDEIALSDDADPKRPAAQHDAGTAASDAAATDRLAARESLRRRNPKLVTATPGAARPELRPGLRPVPAAAPPVAGEAVDPYPPPTPMEAVGAPENLEGEPTLAIQAGSPGDGEAEAAPPAPAPRLADAAPAAAVPAAAGGAAALLDVEHLLPLAVVRDLVGERRVLAVGPLSGLPSSATYGSVYYSVPGQESFGAAVQAWQDATRRDHIERFRRMREQSPGADDTKLLEPVKAFYAAFGAIQTLTLSDTNKRLIVAVSCGRELCTQQALLKLAQYAQQQM